VRNFALLYYQLHSRLVNLLFEVTTALDTRLENYQNIICPVTTMNVIRIIEIFLQ